jgi:dolichol-phosphate mannosyltransferase
MIDTLFVIAPCFNEAKNIKIFYERIVLTIKELNINYKIFFIDDGSVDKTWDIIKELKNQDKNIRATKFSRNFGHQNAIFAGIQKADGDYVLILDVDLQDPPELLKEMYNKIKIGNVNLVYAQRTKNNEAFFKRITSIFFYKIFNYLSEIKIPEQTSDFRIFDKKVLLQLQKFKEKNPFYRGIVSWMGFKSEKIIFERSNRIEGKSGWSLKKMINFSIDGLISFSNYPMRLSFIISIIMCFVFVFLTIYALYSYLTNNVVPGWTSIILVICFFNVIIFFLLGLISEYVGRIHFEVKNRPNFISIDEIE